MRHTRKLFLTAIILSTLGAMAWADVPELRLPFLNNRSYRAELLSAQAVKPVVTAAARPTKVLLADNRSKPPLPRRRLEPVIPVIETVVTVAAPEVRKEITVSAPQKYEPWNRVTVTRALVRSFGETLTIRACDDAATEKFGNNLPVTTECRVSETGNLYVSVQKKRDNDYQSCKLQWMER